MKENIEKFTPVWFLRALGNGGLAVSFFMYLMFMVKHETPIPVFSDIYREVSAANFWSVLIVLDLAVILYFSWQYVRQFMLQWRRYTAFRKTEAYRRLKGGNGEITLMAIPLTMAMGINVAFILGAVYIPGLWSVVEYLFPFALAGYLAVGVYALKLFTDYFRDTLAQGNFDFVENSSLAQVLAPFAFAMVAVGLAAPAAMSHVLWVNVTGFVFSVFFLMVSLALLAIKLMLGFKSIFRHGIRDKAAPTLWIVIPVTTLVGITFVRLISGMYHHILHQPLNPVVFTVLLTVLVSVQVIFGLLGYSVMKKADYFSRYVSGDSFDVGSYALICPGVALNVLGMFFLHFGFVKTGFFPLFSLPYFLLLLPLVFVQYRTVRTVGLINRKAVL